MKNERNRLILICLRFYSLFSAWKIVHIHSVIVFQICIYHNIVLLLFILPGQSLCKGTRKGSSCDRLARQWLRVRLQRVSEVHVPQKLCAM